MSEQNKQTSILSPANLKHLGETALPVVVAGLTAVVPTPHKHNQVHDLAQGVDTDQKVASPVAAGNRDLELKQGSRLTFRATGDLVKHEKPAEPVYEVLNKKTQKAAESMAERIIEAYEHAPEEVEHWVYKDKKDGVDAINVLPNAATNIPGAYGEYGLMAEVKHDANGNYDPKTVSSVSLFMNNNVAGKSTAEKPGDRVIVYNFSLSKDKQGIWSAEADGLAPSNKAGWRAEGVFNRYNYAGPGAMNVNTAALLDALTVQADAVLTAGLAQKPVDYATQPFTALPSPV